jgi:MFS transporter, putative metabolite:H+ symporter
MTVQQAIDAIGFGRFQRRLLLICGVTWAADAAELLAMGFALPGVREEFELSAWESGLVASSTFLGMLVGATFWGTIADRIGLRTGFQLTVLIFAVFGTASAVAPSLETLIALRVLTGFGLGGALPLDFSLMTEFLPSRNRGRYLVLLESFWAVGTVAIAVLAFLIVAPWGWRPLLAASGLAALLVVWIRRTVPESPRYLATAGRAEEAERIVEEIARVNGAERPGRLSPGVAPEHGAVGKLWRGELRRPTLTLWLAWFAIGLAYYGLFVYLPTIFVDRGFSFVRTYGFTLILAAAQISGYLSAAWLVERRGRRSRLFTYPSMGWASAMSRIAAALVTLLGATVIAGSLSAALIVFGAAFLVGAAVVGLLGEETRGRALVDA